MRRPACLATAVVLAMCVLLGAAVAAPSQPDASALKSTLTPLGAERAGNKDGSIPAWTGGLTSAASNYVEGTPRADPYPSEKPIFSITQGNLAAYSERLPEGAKALFARFPDYRMDIYPSHRTAAAPDWVYANILLNATRAHPAPEGIAYGVSGAVGGIPFPVPKDGYEAMWNHLLAFWGPAREVHLNTYVVSAGGEIDLASSYREIADFPYYYPGATPDSYGGYYFKTLHLDDGPPAHVGEGYLDWQPINTARYNFAAWRILPGEHRVRRSPALSYDIPDPDTDGYESLDEYYMFFGGLDHYDFKLLGKREMFVPYNNNRLYQRPTTEILGPRHANPNELRYELHRVWVVEGTLRPGAHDVVSRRRLYLDEDTWMAVYSDSWDNDGKLWKFGQATMYAMPEVPAVVLGSQFIYDLERGGYVYAFAFNNASQQYKVTPPHPAAAFTPESLAAHAIR